MDDIKDYYRKSLIYDAEKYIFCCEIYDKPFLTEDSYEMYIFDRIFYDYNSYMRGENFEARPFWEKLSRDVIDDVASYIENMLRSLSFL